MEPASGRDNAEVAKVYVQPVPVEPSGQTFKAAVRDEEFEIPNDEDLKTLRRVSGKIPWSA